MCPPSRQSGNVLFLILIAVALFAALSYVVTQSTRSGGGDISKEKMGLAFDAVLNQVSSLRSAFTRMTLGGVKADSINACSPLPACSSWTTYGYPFNNALCPASGTDNYCKLYHTQGGGAVFFDFATQYPNLRGNQTNPAYTTFLGYSWWGLSGGGLSFASDIVYSISVSHAFCDYINTTLKIAPADPATNSSGIGYIYQMDGSSLGDESNDSGIGSVYHAPHMQKMDMGCWVTNSAPYSYVFSALIYGR